MSDTVPPWLNTGDNAWQLTAATLVGLQSVPGLVILYAGWVKKKWAVNSAFMAFYGFAAVLICWVLWAYKMGFGEEWAPFVGKPGPLMTIDNAMQQTDMPASGITTQFPISTMAYFQFVFAAITIVIIAGAYLCRMSFLAWMIFVPLWLTFSYTVGAFSLWGGGFLQRLGVIDFSGGYVIHLSSGTAGFVGAAWIGPRSNEDREMCKANHPNNVLLMLAGAGIVWLGWNGFNGGDPYSANADASVAVLNTNIATAMSVLVWTVLDVATRNKPSVIGAVQGMLSGLVGITPAAGVINPWSAVIIGIFTGSIPWITLHIFGRHTIISQVDDTLRVFDTHAIAGLVGGFLVGIFATADGCAAFGSLCTGGAIAGNGRQVGIQLVGAIFIILLNVIMTSLILGFIKYILRIRLRMDDDELAEGDNAIHGEEAYIFGPPPNLGDPAVPPVSHNLENGSISGPQELDSNSE